MYAAFVRSMPGGEDISRDDIPSPKYFQRKLKQARLVFMVINALELAFAKSRASLSGDGASDTDVRRGIREFFVFVAEVVGADGCAKAIYRDC